jgi:nucleotide-binding universal stress UspA family protein
MMGLQWKTVERESDMFQTILAPTDGSPLSEKATTAAIELTKQLHAKLVTISVAEPAPFVALSEGGAFPGDLEAYQEKALEVARHRVQPVADAAKTAGVPCETLTVLSFSPYEEIVQAAEQYHCDLIFMASHSRRGLTRLFLGSETQKVLAHSTIPVLVYR